MIVNMLLSFAFVFFMLGTFFSVGSQPPGTWYGRLNIVSLGLACWVMADLMMRTGLLGK